MLLTRYDLMNDHLSVKNRAIKPISYINLKLSQLCCCKNVIHFTQFKKDFTIKAFFSGFYDFKQLIFGIKIKLRTKTIKFN